MGGSLIFLGEEAKMNDEHSILAVPAMIATVGFGLIAAAGVSLFLARKWDVAPNPGDGDGV